MTTSTLPRPSTETLPHQQHLASTSSPATSSADASGKVRTWNIIRSEWIKFWSVRSTAVTLVAAAIATVAFGMIFSAVAESGAATPGPAAFLSNPVDVALAGIGITEMVIGVLGVMVVAGEYSTGLIRTSFAAAGKRMRVVRAKAAVVGASVFVISAVAVTGAIAAGQAMYAGSQPTVPIGETVDVILGTTVYLTGIALIGIALGFILRSTAGAIGTLVGAVFIGPNLLSLLPDSITEVFLKYLPSEAGAAIMSQVSNPDLLSRGAGYAVFTAWVIGLLGLAGLLVVRRDA